MRALLFPLIVLCVPCWAWASPDHDAVAMIQIVDAIITIGKQRADLPDRPPRAGAVPRDQHDAGDTSPREGAGSTYGAPMATDPIFASVIVRSIENGRGGWGSGTVIHSDSNGSDILSCAHVSDGIDHPKHTVEWNGHAYDAILTRRSRTADLAVYHIAEKLPWIELGRTPSKGAKVYSIGQLKQSPELDLIGIEDRQYTAAYRETNGRSGGGLFFEHKLIGVINGVNAIQTVNKSYYVSLEEIRSFLSVPLPPQAAVPKPHSLQPMTMSIQPPVQAGPGSIDPPLRVIVVTTTNCKPCEKFVATNGDGDERIAFEYLDADKLPADLAQVMQVAQVSPTAIWHDANGTLRYASGFRATDDLYALIQRNNPPQPEFRSYGAGYSASIDAGPQIDTLFQFWRERIGEGIEATFRWDRGQSNSMNLLHLKDWSDKDIFGSIGRIAVSAKGAISLPVEALAFTYQIIGDDIRVDADSITIAGLAKSLRVNQSAASQGGFGVIGLDDAVIGYQALQLISGIMSLLWPQFDLVLPATIEAKAKLQGDTISVIFSSAPSVRIVMLFRFTVSVSSVEIVQGKYVRLNFSGSRWIRSKEFAISSQP